jgi:hypothetical protein
VGATGVEIQPATSIITNFRSSFGVAVEQQVI